MSDELQTKKMSRPAPPDAQTIYESFTKYPSLIDAILEIVDNSGEYGPTTRIDVTIDIDKHLVTIGDDGRGLNETTMLEMVQIKKRDHVKGATGKYGYGFKAAEVFIAGIKNETSLIISKQQNTFTWGKPRPNGKFEFQINSPQKGTTDYEPSVKRWKEFAANPRAKSGTLILMKACSSHILDKKFIKELEERLSVTYKNFDKQNIKLYLNDKEIIHKSIEGNALTCITPFYKKACIYKSAGPPCKFVLSVLMLPQGDTRYPGINVFRNGRLVGSQLKLTLPKIMGAQASMRGCQIIIEGGSSLDDFLRISATKTLQQSQEIDIGFRTYLLKDTGLKKAIDAIYETGRSSQKTKTDGTQWVPFLNHMSKFVKRHARPILMEVSEGHTSTPLSSGGPPRAPKTNKGKTNPGRQKTRINLDKYKGGCSLKLESLGKDGMLFDYEDKILKDGNTQVVISFNSDIPWVNKMIDAELNDCNKDFVRRAIATVMTMRDSTLTSEELTQYRILGKKLNSNIDEYYQNFKELTNEKKVSNG